jgi:predicted outer membrane lipoprotein
VARELARVRRAWKRRTSLAGLAAWLLETLGLFSVAMLANLLFDLHMVTRLLMLGVVVALSAAFFVWKVVRPWLRSVSDRDVALFVEANSPGFEGSLMAAAEFGPDSNEWARHRQIVQSIIDAAVTRARRLDVRSGLRGSLQKLRKYGAALLALVCAFAVVSVLAPEHVHEQAIRVVNPFWEKPSTTAPLLGMAHDMRGIDGGARPLRITELRHGGGPLTGVVECRRGGRVSIQAVLNRDPAGTGEDVRIHFRPTAVAQDAHWDQLPMDLMETVFGYGVTLTDVNEDLEFYVSAGASESARCHIRVFDPLAIERFRIVTDHPGYLAAPPSEVLRPNANVRALEQSRVTLDVQANNRLASGRLRWEDGAEDAGKLGPGDGRTLRVAFDVTETSAFRLVLEDHHGQELETSSYVVEAMKDLPPTLTLSVPRSDVATSPLGEMDLEAHASDDIGLGEVSLVYINGADPSSLPQRVPLKLDTLARRESGGGLPSGGATDVKATRTIELETFEGGGLKVGDMFSWYLEAKDRKGQTAVTDVHFLYIRPYEEWAFRAITPGGEEFWSLSKPTTFADPISKWVAAAWNLRTEKPDLAREEYVRRCRELGEKLRRSIKYIQGGMKR